MSDKPKRRVWQIHLSTAVLLMFVTGGLMWANSRERFQFEKRYDSFTMIVAGLGWPKIWRYRLLDVPPKYGHRVDRNAKQKEHILLPDGRTGDLGPIIIVSDSAYFIDIVCGLGCLILAALFCEFIIRRREARKP